MILEKQANGSIKFGDATTDDILNEVEAARFLKVSRMTLLRWRKAGKLGCYRPGGFRVTYSKTNHLLPFLNDCEQNATVTFSPNEKAAALAAA